MEHILDFMFAAAPWLVIGLLLAVFFAREARKKQDNTSDYGTVGMSLGMCFGAALSTAFGGHAGLGIPLGMLIGLAIGSGIQKDGNDHEEK